MLTFIVNPMAGNGRTKDIMKNLSTILERKGIKYETVYTKAPGHATTLAKEISEGETKAIAIVGGDGTVSEAINGLLDTEKPIGIIPGGTGNDFVTSLGVPLHPEKALDIILDGFTDDFDIGMANDRAFVNVAGMGFDVEVIKCNRITRKYLRGLTAYALAVIIAIFSAKKKSICIRANDFKLDRDILLLAVANNGRYGGGMRIAPGASIHDDLLDVVIIKWVPKWQIPIILPKVIKGTHMDMDIIEHFKANSVDIDADSENVLNLDGELRSSTPANFRIAPRKLRFFTPKVNAV